MRIYMPSETPVDTSLIDWLPPGEAFYTRDEYHDMWEVKIGETLVAGRMDKNVALWVATQINDARGQTERNERAILRKLTEKYGPV